MTPLKQFLADLSFPKWRIVGTTFQGETIRHHPKFGACVFHRDGHVRTLWNKPKLIEDGRPPPVMG